MRRPDDTDKRPIGGIDGAIVGGIFGGIYGRSFADIFHKNCFDNGIVPVHLPEDRVSQVMSKAKSRPGYQLTVDLESCQLTDSDGLSFAFRVHNDPEVHDFRRHCLLNGLDAIGYTMQFEDDFQAFETRYREELDWLYGPGA